GRRRRCRLLHLLLSGRQLFAFPAQSGVLLQLALHLGPGGTQLGLGTGQLGVGTGFLGQAGRVGKLALRHRRLRLLELVLRESQIDRRIIRPTASRAACSWFCARFIASLGGGTVAQPVSARVNARAAVATRKRLGNPASGEKKCITVLMVCRSVLWTGIIRHCNAYREPRGKTWISATSSSLW